MHDEPASSNHRPEPGLPVLAAAPESSLRAIVVVIDEPVIWVLLIVGCRFLANLITCNLKLSSPASTGATNRPELSRALAPALVFGIFGIVLAFISPEQVRGVGMVPAAELVAILNYQDGERYRLVVIDGALLVGALAAIALNWT